MVESLLGLEKKKGTHKATSTIYMTCNSDMRPGTGLAILLPCSSEGKVDEDPLSHTKYT